MKIEPEELKRALAAPGYDPSRVILIVDAPDENTWKCLYMLPPEAGATIDRIAAMGEPMGSKPPARWGHMLNQILAKQQTAIVKVSGSTDRFKILLQGYNSSGLRRLRAAVVAS